MLVMDSGQGHLLHVNAEAERLLGLHRSQLLGQAAGEVLPSALAALCQPPRWRALESSSRLAAREALWLPHAKGPRWVQLQRSLIPWSGLRRPAGMLTL
ncbi:MAG: PAS domain-containing protein, partial [Roseateles sp.]